MNSDLTRKALERVGNPHILVNIVSRRVRQLNAGGPSGRPLTEVAPGTGVADIALLEIVEGKVGWDLEHADLLSPAAKAGAQRKG